MPYSQNSIIISKYNSAMIFAIVAFLYTLLIQAVIQFISPTCGVEIATLQTIWITVLTVMFFTSIYLPFFYRFTNKYLLSEGSLAFIVVIFVWEKITTYINLSNLIHRVTTQFSSNELMILASIVIILMFIGSYLLTVKIYKRTDFQKIF
ncbi:ABC-2 transporter permease [Bacillus sp. 22475]|uniref:ABC-2 transporter permease n=1 Tax=Bacillus sp. 22475 TaxID=3453925 RepID=UPI003F87DB36